MQLRDDPEVEHRRCDCTGGWRDVTDVFARQEAGLPQGVDITPWSLAEHGTVERNAWRTYVATLNSVYPCPECKPGQFRRWRHGCYQPGHVAKTCKRCTPRDER